MRERTGNIWERRSRGLNKSAGAKKEGRETAARRWKSSVDDEADQDQIPSQSIALPPDEQIKGKDGAIKAAVYAQLGSQVGISPDDCISPIVTGIPLFVMVTFFHTFQGHDSYTYLDPAYIMLLC